jgi:hypothetical protein
MILLMVSVFRQPQQTQLRIVVTLTKIIVAYLLKAKIVKPAETAVARKWLCKHARCYAMAQ